METVVNLLNKMHKDFCLFFFTMKLAKKKLQAKYLG